MVKDKKAFNHLSRTQKKNYTQFKKKLFFFVNFTAKKIISIYSSGKNGGNNNYYTSTFWANIIWKGVFTTLVENLRKNLLQWMIQGNLSKLKFFRARGASFNVNFTKLRRNFIKLF